MLTAAFFVSKAVIPADILQKMLVHFLVLMQKEANPSRKQVSAEEKQKIFE